MGKNNCFKTETWQDLVLKYGKDIKICSQYMIDEVVNAGAQVLGWFPPTKGSCEKAYVYRWND